MHIAGVVLHNLMKIFSQFDHKKRGGMDAMVHGTIASAQVSTHSSHPLRYPFTYLRKLRDLGGGGVGGCML